MTFTRSLLSMPLLVGLCSLPAHAQITSAANDAGTIVNKVDNQFNITGGTQAGANLFHSFQQFGLNQGQIANFLANPSIQNILGRVIGGNPSVIHGLIQVTGGNSNLYLVNPAGIVFGANARLNVPGSFTATTANGIGFGDGWFSASSPNNYATLVGAPDRVAFATSQLGSIINAGNLSVGTGQRLTLLGGTVINTGTLTAPNGTVTVAAVAGETLVRITETGSLLSLELPLADRTALAPNLLTPRTLPELLTGGNMGNAIGVSVDASGVVRLTGSTIAINPGDVVAKTVTAQTATLSAVNNLTLVESQLQTTGDLTLLAQNTVRIRDTVVNPVRIQAGGTLTVQGNQTIDILALNHPDAAFQAGSDLTLVSDGVISGDAHFASGGNVSILNTSGNPGTFISFYDPIISSNGDVVFGDYTGVSLKVEAKGSITGGNITITGPDTSYGLFQDWQAIGDVRYETSRFGSGPTVAPSQALITTSNPNAVPQADLETFLGLAVGSLDGLGNGDAIEGSALKTTFTAQAGDVVSFNWQFLTDAGGTTRNDFAFVTLTTLSTLANIGFPDGTGSGLTASSDLLNFPGATFFDTTGTQTFTATIPATGTYTLGVGVVDVTAIGTKSGVLIDNVSPKPLLVSDQSLLAGSRALILRAGVTELQNPPNVPQLNVPTVPTNFTSPGMTSPGTITVGNINTVSTTGSLNSGLVILSAAGGVTAGATIDAGSLTVSSGGDIKLGAVRTFGRFSNSNPYATGSVTLTNTAGNIIVDTISVALTGDITIDAFGVFQAQRTINRGFTTGGPAFAPVSLVAPGKISILHGGEGFIAGAGVERDANGNVIFRDTGGLVRDENGTVIGFVNPNGPQVFISEGFSSLFFQYADGTIVSNSGDRVTVTSVPFNIDTISPNISFTAGVIFKGNGSNGAISGAFQNRVLTGSADIQVTAVARPKPNSIDPIAPIAPKLVDSGALRIQIGEEGKIAQQRLGQRQDECPPAATVATERRSPTRPTSNPSDRAITTVTNPCISPEDDAQILKLLDD